MRVDRQWQGFAAGILLLAAVWRATVALTLPCIARDSVMFCWFARDLGEKGLAHLRDPMTQHHPLFPALVLATQRTARLLGAPDSPLTWQRSGQVVSWLAGMAVVALSGLVTLRLVRELNLPIRARSAACFAMLLAALLPLNVWLSAEVMSDELHLALYLAGIWALLKLDGIGPAIVCGVAAGSAFLTRPEGLVLLPAGLISLAADIRSPASVRGGRAALLVAAFLLCAAPYWLAVGELSPQKNPLEWFRDRAAAVRHDIAAAHERAPKSAAVRGANSVSTLGRGAGWTDGTALTPRRVPARGAAPVLARLERLEVSWYGLVPFALYQLFRAGRVVIPLLALFPLINLGARLLRVPLIGFSACLAGHFALTLLLLARYRYLDQRHMLVAASLLVPFAALLLARLLELAGRPGARALLGVVALPVLPLALYSLRQPNRADGYLAAGGRWLARRDPDIAAKVIMSASRERRVVFYAGARWLYWYDVPGDVAGPRQQILREHPDYFVIETGEDFERAGNRLVVEAIRADSQIVGHIHWTESWTTPKTGSLYVFCFDWRPR